MLLHSISQQSTRVLSEWFTSSIPLCALHFGAQGAVSGVCRLSGGVCRSGVPQSLACADKIYENTLLLKWSPECFPTHLT